MFNINNTTIKRMILEHLVERVDTGGLDEILAAGFSPELLDDLRKRPSRDFFYAAQTDGLTIRVQIDTKSLRTCLWTRDRAQRDEMLKEYFIRNGASILLMRSLFTLSKHELHHYRVALDIAQKTATGRPRLPPTAIRDRIHDAWFEICRSFREEPERERLWRLHQTFSAFSIASLHRCTDEFKDPGDCIGSRSAPLAIYQD
ncbi:hypothetical protein LPB72_09690 [Hydrogenophaga crassostreae]|jgi:hypothetical protein|uniref:DUF2857 domain-containing protein n=1 Tax=Hydrogenophaga crassostreae TaxID=1763535 RepID=A0A167HQJ5_9BURK|nr:STY4526/YPO1902 family pathogenicity island replication protein [Hydrogenophaga crassostreae]AOW13315.1 hypothetical protein LPB072_11075 [Hydrogenophaga crassostreae]OAD41596.1 hypothetical protein LPB72_09690 [Hydrogenophaga crassostreae]